MRLNENNLIMEQYQQVLDEAKKKPSAGLTKKQKSDVAKKARAGKDIGKKGPGFAKMAKAAGGGEKGKKIAAAAMWKSIKRESAGILSAYEGKKLLNESVSSEQYDEVVGIIHDAVNAAARSNQKLSAEINQVWDVVSDIWADNEMQVYNTVIGEESEKEMSEESDPMIPKVEKILQKMTEDYGSEDLAVEELSKWDEDEMNEYYNNRVMNEEEETEPPVYKVGDRVYLSHGDEKEHYNIDIEYPGTITRVVRNADWPDSYEPWEYWYKVDGEDEEDGPHDSISLKPVDGE